MQRLLRSFNRIKSIMSFHFVKLQSLILNVDRIIHQRMNIILNNIHQVEVHHRNHLVIMDLEVNVPRIYHRVS
jgi:hypothetical protein